jgi:hypothetical protein
MDRRKFLAVVGATVAAPPAWATKNAVAKSWHLLTNYDGLLHSEYPNGDKPVPPAEKPLILYTDFTAGPTTGGENNKGCYISVFGLGFGTFAEWGVTNHLTIGGVEVDNYRCLDNAVGSGTTGLGTGVYQTWGIQRIVAQVGAIGNPTAGTELAINITINGTSPKNATSGGFNLDLDGNRLSFTPQPGPIVFVSKTGSDTTGDGSFANPYRTVQTWNSGTSTFTGAVWGPFATGTSKAPPGQHTIIRGGEYGSDLSYLDWWVNLIRFTGLPPTGAANTGPMCFTSYPGVAGGNAPERVTWNGAATGKGGGFTLNDTTRSTETPPWTGATVGYCQDIQIANLLIKSHPGANTDGAPINQQTHAQRNRIVNCDLSFPSNTGSPTAGGIAGYGTSSCRYGNYIHDVYDASGNLQNHGTYIGTNLGANSGAQGELHGITAYNVYKNCTGGQSIMMRGSMTTESTPYESVHHNWCEGHGKHGIEAFDGRDRANIWCNIIIAGTTGKSGFYCDSDNVSATGGIYFGYNTIIGWVTYCGIYLHGSNGGGSVRVQSNAIYQKAGQAATFGMFANANGMGYILDGNCWYDASGVETAKPSDDTAGTFADPLFTSLTTKDYTPLAGSPLLNAGVTPPSFAFQAFDFFGVLRPQGSATKYSIGAIEKAGG